MKIYLDEPITIEFTKIGHTYYGVCYLAEHYSSVLSVLTPKQISEPDRQHVQEVIERLRFHKTLYEKHRPELTAISVQDAPEGVG